VGHIASGQHVPPLTAITRKTRVSRYENVFILDVIGAKMMEMVVTAGAIRRAEFQSNHHHQQTITQLFTGRMLFLSPNQQCQSTEGKSFTFHGLSRLRLTWWSSILS